MLRLLIVDDEKMITDGLYEILSRVEDFSLDMYKTYSSLEALELINRVRFDIVLTDIRMPGINGLQLAEQLRSKWPKCRIVFLTGHDEFDYVYQAIKHERVSYLLKTEGYDKIIETLRFAIEEITAFIQAEEMEQFVEEQQTQLLHTSRQRFCTDMLHERLHVDEVSDALLQQLDVPLCADEPILLLLGKFKLNNQLGYTERSRLHYEMEWLANYYFNEFEMKQLVVMDEPMLIWMLQPAANSSQSRQEDAWSELIASSQGHIDQLQEAFASELGVDVSLVLDHRSTSWRQLAERYEKLSLLFQYRIGAHDTQLILSTDRVNQEQKMLMNKNAAHMIKAEKLQACLHNGQQEEFFEQLQQLSERCQQAATDSIAEEIYLTVAMIYFSYMNRWSLLEQLSEQVRIQRLLRFHDHASRAEAFQYLETLGKQLFEMQNEEEEGRAAMIIDKVQRYILEHLHDTNRLTLVHLAEMVFFNASYLSRLFKQITNINLSDFIIQARMERAKQLLEQPELKIQDVAERIGYSNATNFTRVFRKLTGYTPQDFRQMMIDRQ